MEGTAIGLLLSNVKRCRQTNRKSNGSVSQTVPSVKRCRQSKGAVSQKVPSVKRCRQSNGATHSQTVKRCHPPSVKRCHPLQKCPRDLMRRTVSQTVPPTVKRSQTVPPTAKHPPSVKRCHPLQQCPRDLMRRTAILGSFAPKLNRKKWSASGQSTRSSQANAHDEFSRRYLRMINCRCESRFESTEHPVNDAYEPKGRCLRYCGVLRRWGSE